MYVGGRAGLEAAIIDVDPFAFFFFNDTATTEIYTLSLHDALPILLSKARSEKRAVGAIRGEPGLDENGGAPGRGGHPETRPLHAAIAPGMDPGRGGPDQLGGLRRLPPGLVHPQGPPGIGRGHA